MKPTTFRNTNVFSATTALVGAAVALPLASAQAPASTATSVVLQQTLRETPAQHDKRMQWFRDARFGLFIHWGVYAVPAGEWNGKTNYGEWFLEETKMPVSQYEKFANQFNPTKFDARAWVKLAKDAGMKYIVITSKHHDGFAMYRSNLSNWGIKRTAFQRDPIQELAEACRKEGIKLCFYHSIMDWHHPDYTPRRAWNDVVPAATVSEPDYDRYVAYMKGQLKELLTKYGPIGILWFDGEWESTWNNQRGIDLYNYVRSLQPNIIINNRVGKGRAGMQGMNKGEGVGDYGTPEQEIPSTGFGPGVDWESCMTMNDHWGYNKNDHNWKSAETLVRNLIDCASKGGNYLLNVGPTAAGEIPGPSIERLRAIGAWMKTNRESIYGTTASPFQKLSWGRATKKIQGNNSTLYLHVWNWPADGVLRVPGLKNTIQSAYLLGAPRQKLAAINDGQGVTLRVPTATSQSTQQPISTTIVLRFKGAPQVEEQILAQNIDGTLQLPPDQATMHGALKLEQKADGRDNLGFWLNAADWVEWQFKAVRPGRYQVSAEVATPEATALEMIFGNQKVRAAIPATGDYTRFQPLTFGTLQIGATGNATLQLKPTTDWKPINLRALSFKPVP
ncbi:MAG: alpha-L-fucosidase [Abditibacteriota bacterium]|nr:alpha-L-fucosidase [Abditibacteriota bacterium]